MSNLQDKYVNPLTDFGFKRLFGTEPNKNLLIDFLNQILPERHQIRDLTYARNEQVSDGQLDRKAIFDLHCTSESGERFIVELQKVKQKFFKDRSVYYASFPIRAQAVRGDWDFELQAVYTVGILDFTFEEHENDPQFLHIVELKDQHCRVFYDKLKFIYIELPKFTKTAPHLETQFEKWLFVFRHLADLQKRPRELRERVFGQLFRAAEIANFTPKERLAYEDSLKYYRDLKNAMNTYLEEGREAGLEEGRRLGLEEGWKQGKQQGLEEGKQQGLEEGKQQGLEEGRKKASLRVAVSLIATGMATREIAKHTGLDEAKIDALRP